MTRRGQNPYANPAAPSSYSAVPSSYNPPSGGPSYSNSAYDAPPAAAAAKPFKGKGMQLGGGKGRKNNDDLAAALGGLSVDDGDLPLLQHQQHQQVEHEAPTAAAHSSQQYQPPAPATPAKDANPFGDVEQSECVAPILFLLSSSGTSCPARADVDGEPARSVHLVVREALSLALNRDGGISSLSLKGDLDLRINAADYAAVVLRLPSPASGAYPKANDLQFKTHPNVDKAAWAQRGEIRLKEGKKGFPVGQGLGVLKWRMTGTDESVVPLSSASSSPFVSQPRPTSSLTLAPHTCAQSTAGRRPTLARSPSTSSTSSRTPPCRCTTSSSRSRSRRAPSRPSPRRPHTARTPSTRTRATSSGRSTR